MTPRIGVRAGHVGYETGSGADRLVYNVASFGPLFRP